MVDVLIVVPNLRHDTRSGRWSDIERKAARLVPLHGPSVNLIIHDKTYTITREDLEYLAARVGELRTMAEAACRKKIDDLTS